MSGQQRHPVVSIAQGRILGERRNRIAVFRGIPYAEPPEGHLRFQAPQARRPWEGIRECVTFGAAAPQAAPAPGVSPAWRPGDGLDCLTLNVWTPDPAPGQELPVMVWIHGGMWIHGSTRAPQYDAERLADAGVVAVTINYRLGFEGFGHLPGAPDNRGLLDQLAALRWVQENIAGFGGAPGNVTVFGQSAGAASIIHLASAAAAGGLFRRAVAQSVPVGVRSAAAAGAVTAQIARALGVAPTWEGMASIAPQALIDAQRIPLRPLESPTAFGPVLDAELVTGEPGHNLSPASAIDLMCGFTHDEWHGAGGAPLPADVPLAPVIASVGLPPSAAEMYRAAYPGFRDPDLAVVVLSDALIRLPTVNVAEAHAASGGRTWMYELRWPSPILGTAGHCLDIPLIFGDATSRYAQRFLGATPPDDYFALSQQMRTAWTSFAADGDPGWGRYDHSERTTHIFDTPAADLPDPLKPSRLLWNEVNAVRSL